MLMRKIFKPFLIASSLILLFSTSLLADNFTARIIDVAPPRVSIELQGLHALKKGDHIELSYMAGVMEMLIGLYEITQIQNDVLIVCNISSAFYPAKDMKVMITKVENIPILPSDMGPDPSAFDPAEMNLNLLRPPSHDSPAQDSSQQMDSSAQP